jgi:hypothetical protein
MEAVISCETLVYLYQVTLHQPPWIILSTSDLQRGVRLYPGVCEDIYEDLFLISLTCQNHINN